MPQPHPNRIRCRQCLAALTRGLGGLGSVAWLLAAAMPAQAGTNFVDVSPDGGVFQTPPTHDYWLASITAADFDGDGDLDLAVFGFEVEYNVSAVDQLRLLRNDGIDTEGRQILTESIVPTSGLFGSEVHLSSADYDQDGDTDLLLASEGLAALFRNDGGVLTQTDIALPAYREDSSFESAYDLRAVSWGDLDNDGDLDIVLPTVDAGGGLLQLVPRWARNDGPDGAGTWVFTVLELHEGTTSNVQTRLADADGDGDLDLWEADIDNTLETGSVRRYDNLDGQFLLARDLGISPVGGSADWADVDADGDLDVLLAGSFLDGNGDFVNGLRLYLDQAGSYVAEDLPLPSFEWLDILAASWADYDGDGDIDLLLSGSIIGPDDIEGEARIYLNDGAGNFTVTPERLPAPISSVGRGGAFLWLDIDGDADLDYLASGAFYVANGNGLVEARTFLMRNPGSTPNQPPAAPAAPIASVGPNTLLLQWTAPTDDSTPATALTYELKLFSGAAQIPAQALPSMPGTLGQVTQWRFDDLPEGNYRWQLQALDRAHAASEVVQGVVDVPGADALFGNGFE